MKFKVRGLDCAVEVTVLKAAIGPVIGGERRLAFDVLSHPHDRAAWWAARSPPKPSASRPARKSDKRHDGAGGHESDWTADWHRSFAGVPVTVQAILEVSSRTR